MSKRTASVLCVLVFVGCFAFADTIQTFTSTYGTITVDYTTSKINLVMNSGYSLKIQDGNDFSFNCGGCAQPSLGPLTVGFGNSTVNNVVFGVASGQNIGSGIGTYNYSLTGIGTGMSSLQGITSVTTLELMFAGNVTFTSFALHVCGAGGTNCDPNTFFAEFTPTSQTPEPASMMLLGSGLLAIGGYCRKRMHFPN